MTEHDRQYRRHSRRGMSVRGQRALWGALGALFGPLAGLELGRGLPDAVLAGVVCALAAAALAPQLTQALPIFGVVVGPGVTLALMNLQRFTASATLSPAPVTPRAARAGPLVPISHLTTGIGIFASALLAVVLLHALSRTLRGERRPLRPSFRSLAWICFWITLAMILISHFAPV